MPAVVRDSHLGVIQHFGPLDLVQELRCARTRLCWQAERRVAAATACRVHAL